MEEDFTLLNDRYEQAVKTIKTAILQSQYNAVKQINKEQLALYYGIGRYISENSRDGFWGTTAIVSISNRLQKEMPGLRGFSATNIKKMRQFYEEWSDLINRPPMAVKIKTIDNESNILSAIDKFTQLLSNRPPMAAELNIEEFLGISFSHHIEILNKVKTDEEKIFYIHQAYIHQWSKYTLRENLKQDLYHHKGFMPNNFDKSLSGSAQALKAILTFKDEYMLDFINTEDFDENDEELIDERVVENAIVNNIKSFIMKFGHDFSFIGNQYRIEILENKEIFIDLLFFNRELNALVAVELKKGKFKTSYLGQLQLYLRALDDNVRKQHENPSVGIVLCKSADKDYVEYVIQDYNKPMGVATYKTTEEMPEKLRKTLPNIEDLKKLL